MRPELASAAFSLLRKTPDTRTLQGAKHGAYGVALPEALAKTLTSLACKEPPNTWNEASCSWPLLLPSGKECHSVDGLLQARQSRKYYDTAERPWSPRDFGTHGEKIRGNTA